MKEYAGNLNSNSFNFIRLFAALQVVAGHIIMHLDLSVNQMVASCIYFFNGVPIFFGMSGFLIWFSMERADSYTQYLLKRFWRIYPELWAAVFLEILVMLILYHDWKLESLIPFILCQATILQFWTPSSLKGYGIGTPNGTLWTIGVMVQFYIVAWWFFKFMKGRKDPHIWITGFIAAIGISAGGGIFL